MASFSARFNGLSTPTPHTFYQVMSPGSHFYLATFVLVPLYFSSTKKIQKRISVFLSSFIILSAQLFCSEKHHDGDVVIDA